MGFDMETRAINQGTVKVCTGRIASAPPDEVGSTYVPQFSPLTESCSVGLWCRAVGNILRTASVVNPNICHISRRIKPELVVSDNTSAVSLHSDKRMLMVLASLWPLVQVLFLGRGGHLQKVFTIWNVSNHTLAIKSPWLTLLGWGIAQSFFFIPTRRELPVWAAPDKGPIRDLQDRKQARPDLTTSRRWIHTCLDKEQSPVTRDTDSKSWKKVGQKCPDLDLDGTRSVSLSLDRN
ncbi:hypothetical protein RRG08_056282 [Elysia crispata]|uniref:Uncharacterized protein n=1 Tax=Elysia crispata TaxID=231223 RepID=A0AAE1AXT1_9GAST|nr:hypothetical protein RRG08_056282 [Elysia crispata]